MLGAEGGSTELNDCCFYLCTTNSICSFGSNMVRDKKRKQKERETDIPLNKDGGV